MSIKEIATMAGVTLAVIWAVNNVPQVGKYLK